MLPLTKLVLGLALVGVVVGHRVQRQMTTTSTNTLANLSSFINLMTALKYDAPCSWKNEESRQNLTRDLSSLGGSSRFATNAILNTMNRFSNDVVSNGKRFCAAPELLICNKDTERCGCGDPGKAVLFPTSDSSRDYIVERDESGVQRCRWSENTYCLSDDLLKAQGYGTMINSKCQSGTKCIAKASGDECSFHALVTYFLTSTLTSGRRGPRLTIQSIMKDLYAGKVCTCQPDPALNAIPSEEDWDWSSDSESNDIRRRKRSTSSLTVLEEVASHQTEEQRMTGFVAPVLEIQAFF